MRVAGVAWLAYAVLAGAGLALKSTPVSVAATAFYFVVMVIIYRLFAPADPRVALLLLPIEGLACAIQAAGQINDDKDLQRTALVVFAVGLVVLGYLVARSDLLPAPIGYVLALGGMAWCAAVIPGVPLLLAAPLQVFAALSEGALVIAMLVRG